MTKEGCMNHLRTFYPEARDEDCSYILLLNVYKSLKIHLNGYIQFGTSS